MADYNTLQNTSALVSEVHALIGQTIAQAVSRWLPTAAARVRSRGLVKWDWW
jgi:hypothetical protein